mmetsp:Transcript_35759/g.107521  ORF Transcript_35759/g.107521 Transcript_35759/m.107521 type:complete len:270 (+) Transcript_35759:30-839(+)|eukprot:CAMPEP_0182923646 /NCGR_PEP_ID=MMETSP0105_2-20130417/5559_1 /TAXON_ID=81532 ORGANISM="Acanthoeca-like sp., Strain 10tr" /NCGR_SAMPLE_ID=MMETSP0105_2 /ASSEMBLY_ACC=CAM_ASM_000205 /LENGTH=269 /DNA_ID=CAMNT_0025061373 /DNA_START=40 /DNA_END=849 /DNA_ORIENTATION=-
MAEPEEEVFGFQGNVFIESIDALERKKMAAEKKEKARQEVAERRKARMSISVKKGDEYASKIRRRKEEQDAELAAIKQSNRLTLLAEGEEPLALRPKTPAVNAYPLPGTKADLKGSPAAAWEIARVEEALAAEESGEKEKRGSGGRIIGIPNTFTGGQKREHAPGGSYVPDKLLEAHRRLHKGDAHRDDAELLAAAMHPTVTTVTPKNLFRNSDAVMQRADAWIKSFTLESVDEIEARIRREVAERRATANAAAADSEPPTKPTPVTSS